VTAGAVVEEVGGGWSRWLRPAVAASASLAVLAAGAALWEYGRRTGDNVPFDPHDVLLLATGLHFGGRAWLRQRTRRGDLRWRRALVLRRGVRPGLFAPRSKLALALETVAVTGMAGSGLVWAGAELDGWGGRILTAFWAVAVPVLARMLFQALRRPVLVAITSEGIVTERETVPWERITSVDRDKEGVHLRLRDQVRYVTVGGEDCAVSDERLAHVIEYYLATPHRRIALDLNAPGPLGAVR
jgi:hypothetical protein